MFLLLLWLLFFYTDDFVINDIKNKKAELQSRASFMGKIARPIFENDKLPDFQIMLQMYDLFGDPQLLPVHKVKIYKYVDNAEIGMGYVYYTGMHPIMRSPISVTTLGEIGSLGQKSKLNIMGVIFSYYKILNVRDVITDPIISKRSKFNPQYHVIKSGENTYDIRVLAPIKVNRKTVALVEVWEDYNLENAYYRRNEGWVDFLMGISFITIIFGSALAFSIAVPLRRLSGRLNRKLTPSDLAVQMTNMSVARLASRKDEIGLLHNNFIKLTKQIIRLFRDKEQFAADVSHELKNPIASIIAHVENNLETENNNKNSALLKIKNQALRMNKLVSDISEAAIVDHEIVAKKREKFDISNIVDEIAKHYIDEIKNSKIEINVTLQKNINFNGLPDRIAQILINLIENAISFSHPRGSINVSLSRRWRKPLILIVEDSGPGVPENMQELIFERFFTSRTGHSVVKNSSGLGLFMCREIVEAHGGKIHVETSQLGGAKFVVSL
jgi:signal transduction histidine kinase